MEYMTYFGIVKTGIGVSHKMGLPNLFTKQNKAQILDPYSTIIRLAMISYKIHGTKIAISDNKLYIQDPSILQGAIRTFSGSQKDDIQYLKEPIEKAGIALMKSKDYKLKWIFEKAICGLDVLSKTYNEYEIIINCISTYISIIQNFINTVDDDEPELYNEKDNKNKIRNELYNDFISMWTDNQMNVVYGILTELENILINCPKIDNINTNTTNFHVNHEIECLISSIEHFLERIDKRTQTIINNISS